MAEITITKNNFEQEVLQSDKPVLVDFWAAWCGPCRMVAPIVAQIAEEQAGKVKVGKINVDEEPALAMQFGIASIPTLLVFKDGQVVNKAVGYMPKEQLEAMLK
ncbi:MAG: thioredoxin [Clostridiales bacterium]|nr:thioredoxin [Clostridiales bacterium]